MPIATSLPVSNVVIRFPPGGSGPSDNGEPLEDLQESYQLLELPTEILKQVEGGKGDVFPLTIKGRPSDDAVLCTRNSTFLLRTVSISNSLLILRTPSSTSPNLSSMTPRSTLEIRDTSHEVLECVPQAPNLGRIRTILRDSQWAGTNPSDPQTLTASRGTKRRLDAEGSGVLKKKRYTRAQLESVVQASDAELESGLRERNVIEVDGRMLLLPYNHLQPLLTLILTLLTLHSTSSSLTPASSSHAISPIAPIRETLVEDHEVPQGVFDGILKLFGTLEDDGKSWKCELWRSIKEVGKGLLEALKGEKVPSDRFLHDWKIQVGDDWAELVDLKLLEGEYLLDDPSPLISISAKASSPILTPFPSHTLPLHPATRFADLFLTRPKWRPEDMAPFLKGLTRDGDTKERDKLVSKFVRVVREKVAGGKGGERIWWFPRRSA